MIRIFFGSPGAGKTTQICKLLKQNGDRYLHTFCNFDLNEEYNIAQSVSSEKMKTLGQWTFPENSYIAIDEAGIEYNNRKFKTFPQYTIEWFKLHRHYKCDVDIFSQSFEDMDITLRRLATQYWHMRGIGRKYGITILRRCYKYVMVDELTHQIVDGYRLEKPIWILLQPLRLLGFGYIFPQLHGWKLTFRLPYYKYFDTYAHPDLPELTTSSPIGKPQEAVSDKPAGGKLALLRCYVSAVYCRLREHIRSFAEWIYSLIDHRD